MYVECAGKAEFRVKETGEILTVTPDQLDWDSEGTGEEGGMGGEIRHWAEVELRSPQTGKAYSATWQLWEYPEGVQDNQESDFSPTLECLDDFDYCLVHEPDFDDEETSQNEGRASGLGDSLSGGLLFDGGMTGNAEAPPEKRGVEPKSAELRALSSLTKARAESLAEHDFLGRQHITEALRQLIAEREGTQHFALGLFGSWGSGKSSLIFHLAEQLKKNHPEILIAEFNAWKNEKASNLGAMLAQSVVECLTADLNLWQKFRLAMKLVDARNAWFRKGANKCFQTIFPWLFVLFPPLLLVMGVVLLVWALPLPGGDWVKGLAGGVSVVAVAYQSASVFLRNNLGEWFKHINAHQLLSHFWLPSYSEHRGLAGEIHQTLEYLCSLQLGAAGKEKTLLLVVDDLDRCSVNTVKEVFDAVRLVADIPRVITLVAVDEQMAFAAVEKYYDQFGHAGRLPANVAREYLGKILQVSITLPVVDDEYVQRFVEDVLFSGVERKKEVQEESKTELPHKSSEKKRETVTLAVTSEPALPEEIELFRQLAVLYNFRNPRLMGRLYLSWRLLKALRFGGRAYRFVEVEESMGQLFWRELRLQQDAEKRLAMDTWLGKCISSGSEPQCVVPILKDIEEAMLGTTIGDSWSQMVDQVDSVLLPVSTPRRA